MVDVEDKMSQGYLRCRMIIEMLGKPKEHVEETLRMLLEKLKQEDGVELLDGNVHKPKEQGAFFSSFVELEALVKDMGIFATLCFEYMPSSVEITEPENLKMHSRELADFVNDMLARLHDVDMRFKNVNAANQLLNNNLTALLKHSIVLMLENRNLSAEEISKKVGIEPNQLSQFLKKIEAEGLIKSDGSLYRKK